MDYEEIRGLVKDAKKVVIVGSSFIGVECASALKTSLKDLDITMVGLEEFPLSNVFGKEIGKMMLKE